SKTTHARATKPLRPELETRRTSCARGTRPYSHYMPKVDFVLKRAGLKPQLQRTIYKFMANFERWVVESMDHTKILNGYRITGWSPWCLTTWLERWAGFGSLDQADFDFIEQVFPSLIACADAHGTVHEEYARKIMGDFIDRVQGKGLSQFSLAFLAAQLVGKPTWLKPLNQWTATHLTNSQVLADRCTRREEEASKGAAARVLSEIHAGVQALKLIFLGVLPNRAVREAANLMQGETREGILHRYLWLGEEDYLALAKAMLFSRHFSKHAPKICKRCSPNQMMLNA
ncbi:hypothetical protein B484DRAFT_472864, partial [Ochromonadaceae sp. CCMP2298]